MNGMQRIVFAVVIASAIGVGIAVILVINNDSKSDQDGNDSSMPTNNETKDVANDDSFEILPDSNLPVLKESGLRVEKLVTGLARPTSMAFLDKDDILILQKDDGGVRLVLDGRLQQDAIHRISVSKENERGLLGIALTGEANSTRTVFLFYTESDDRGEVRNRVYNYKLTPNRELTKGGLVLDMPGTPGPNHDGGKLTLGPDDMLYAVIGDLNRNGMLQNYPDGNAPDDTSVIVRINAQGNSSTDGILSDDNEAIQESLNRYHAYGIRNSFGIDVDPVTGILWDTENGPSGYDEINIVSAGFNSGWEKIMGPLERSDNNEGDLVLFGGSHYRDPVFSWRNSQGITDIEFLQSARLGDEYANSVFVGDFNNGNLYHFTPDRERDGLSLDSGGSSELSDLVADNDEELEAVIIGRGFSGGITDIETGPDGYLYVLTFGGSLYRIVPDS